MNTLNKLACVIAVSTVFSSAVSAKEIEKKEYQNSAREIEQLIEKGLPDTLSDNNASLVKNLLNVDAGAHLADSLNVERVIATLFEGSKPKVEGDCFNTKEGRRCKVFSGEPSGKGSFSKLAIDSDDLETNIRFVHREAEAAGMPTAQISDSAAYAQAISLLQETFSISKQNIPQAPRMAKNRYPVKSVNVASAQKDKPDTIFTIEKLVTFPRGLYAEKLGWVPGPGKIVVAMNDKGINGASVRNWASMRNYGRGLNPSNAKSRSELVGELVECFQKEGLSHLDSADSVIAISLPQGAESPIPVLRVYAAAQPRDLSEDEQAQVLSTGSVVIEVPLIATYDESDDGE